MIPFNLDIRPRGEALDLSVVVLSTRGLGAANHTLDCVDAYCPLPDDADVTVILSGLIANHGEVELHDPATAAEVAVRDSDIVASVQRAVQGSSAEWVLFLSDDIYFERRALEAVLRAAHTQRAPLSPVVRFGELTGLTTAPASASGVFLLAPRESILAGLTEAVRPVPEALVDLVPPGGPSKRASGLPTYAAAHGARRASFGRLYDFSKGRGLEIGPLDAPLADPAVADVKYVDVWDREGVQRSYAEDENVMIEVIPEIDFPLADENGVIRTVGEAAAPGAPFDWVIASHVIEHVPDVIGWLIEIATLTTDDGALVMAIPDRRYTFDRLRPPTTTGEALMAYEQQHTRPSTRAIYDGNAAATAADAHALWAGGRPSSQTWTKKTVLRKVVQGQQGEYMDVHVWTFTPQSFLAQIKEWRELGLCPWYVELLIETPPGGLEFYAVLRRVPAVGDFQEMALASDLPDWLENEWQLRNALTSALAEIDTLRQRVAALERSARPAN